MSVSVSQSAGIVRMDESLGLVKKKTTIKKTTTNKTTRKKQAQTSWHKRGLPRSLGSPGSPGSPEPRDGHSVGRAAEIHRSCISIVRLGVGEPRLRWRVDSGVKRDATQ